VLISVLSFVSAYAVIPYCFFTVKLIEQGLTSHQTHYRSSRGRFLQVIWPNQQCQSTEGNQMVLQIRLQSHQDHSTMLQLYNSRQPPLASMHGVRVPVWQTQSAGPVRTAHYECAADCEHCVTQPSTEQFW